MLPGDGWVPLRFTLFLFYGLPPTTFNDVQAFYINLVVGALFAPVYVFLLPSINLLKDIPFWQRLAQHIDWMGNVLFIGGISSFIMAVTFGGTSYAWASASEIALWTAAGILLFFSPCRRHSTR